MISSAKYAKAAKTLPSIRGFQEAGAGVVKNLNEGAAPVEGRHLIFVCSSDRGLCGALHTNISRAAIALRKEHADVTVSEVGRNDPSFADCAAIAQTVLENEEWASGTILYNLHKSAMTQEITPVPVCPMEGLEAAEGISAFDSVDGDVIQNFAEFALASTLYGCVKENYCSEQAARM